MGMKRAVATREKKGDFLKGRMRKQKSKQLKFSPLKRQNLMGGRRGEK